MNFEPGKLVAKRYEVIQKLGTGGMGLVYLVRDKELNNEVVALKLLHQHLADDEDVFARFRNEVLVARSLSHPAIVRLHDIGRSEEGFFYISMEYVDGSSLKDWIHDLKKRMGGDENPLSFPAALKIFYQICCGVAYAHGKGIIHRDLKPANVLMSKSGEVKLADFGTARIGSMSQGLTKTGQVIGTPDYMAPEQIQGQPLDSRCDVYALGIMGYELVVGKIPFDADSAVAMAFKHLHEQIPKFADAQKGIPTWYEQLIRKATEKDPFKRYPSAAEFAVDMARYAPEVAAKTQMFPSSGGSGITQAFQQQQTQAELSGAAKTPGDSREFQLGDQFKSGALDTWHLDSAEARVFMQGIAGKKQAKKLALVPTLLGLLAVAGIGASLWFYQASHERIEAKEESEPLKNESTAQLAQQNQNITATAVVNNTPPTTAATNDQATAQIQNQTPPAASDQTSQAQQTQTVTNNNAKVEVGQTTTQNQAATTTPENTQGNLTPTEAVPTLLPVEPPLPVGPLLASNLAIKGRTSAANPIPGQFALEKLDAVDWKVQLKGLPIKSQDELKALLKAEINTIAFDAKNPTRKVDLSESILGDAATLSDGTAEIGGSLAQLKSKFKAGQYTIALYRNEEKLTSQDFSIFTTSNPEDKAKAEEKKNAQTTNIASGASTITVPGTESSKTNPTPPPVTETGTTTDTASLKTEITTTPPSDAAPEQAAGPRHFAGGLTPSSSPDQRLSLSFDLEFSESAISGSADLDGQPYSVSGNKQPRGIELVLRNGPTTYRLTGVQRANALRGRYSKGSEEYGSWEVTGR